MAKLLGGTTVYGSLSVAGSLYASDITTSSGSISASRPSLSSTQTWNNSAVAFAALTTYITNSSSNIESTLLDVGINGSSVAKININGNIWTTGNYTSNGTFSIIPNSSNSSNFGATTRAWCTVANGLVARQNLGIHSGNNNGGFEVAAYSGGANIWEQRNGTNAQTFNLYNTYTSTTVSERAYFKWINNQFQIGTETPGSLTKRDMLVTAASGTGNIFLSAAAVGINTVTPNKQLTVVGDISATGNIYGTLNALTPFVSSATSNLTYTLQTTDNTNTILLSSPNTNYFIVPSAINTPGFQAAVLQLGTGLTYISAGPGVTIKSAGNRYKLYQQYSAATLLYINSNIGWTLFGDLSA